MKYLIHLLMLYMMLGCSEVAENPTAPANYQTVPEAVLEIISDNCAFCHQPEKFSAVFKGQKPYFRNWLPDGNATFLDSIQIWQSKERIGIRVAEGTMPRTSDTTDFFFPLTGNRYDIIIDWAQTESFID